MFATLRIRCMALAAIALLGMTAGADAASANWVTIKNDTGRPIVVQETVMVNGQVKRGKATNLLAGETLREFVPGPTVKRLEVFEAKNPNQAVWSGSLSCKNENETFAVTVTGGKVCIEAVARGRK